MSSLFKISVRTSLPILAHCQRVSQISPHFRCQLKLVQPPLLRRNFAATPRIRYARPSPVLKSDPEPKKVTDVSTESRERPTLRENIYTIPNLLTVSRILACPVLGWSILNNDFYLATGLLVYAGLSDLVSDSLARPSLKTTNTEPSRTLNHKRYIYL